MHHIINIRKVCSFREIIYLAHEVIADSDFLNLLAIHDLTLSDNDLVNQSVEQYLVKLLNRTVLFQFFDESLGIDVVTISILKLLP